MNLKAWIREIPDFPKPGILFKDITPLLKEPEAFSYAVDRMADHCVRKAVDVVAGVEARGFLFAAPLAVKLSKPLVPLRKAGKLPYDTHRTSYALEYGEAAVEVHTDAIAPGSRVLIVDDLLATGGTLAACVSLVESSGGMWPGWPSSSSSKTCAADTASTATTSSPWYITPSDRQLASRAWDIRASMRFHPTGRGHEDDEDGQEGCSTTANASHIG